jgi:hypothetical protein
MKKLILISALLMGTAAFAQDATPTTTEDTMTDTTSQTSTEDQSTQSGSMSGSTSSSGSMSMQSGSMQGGSTVSPGNQNPERDARGIPVVSDPATAPAGANEPVNVVPGARVVPNSNQGSVFTTQQASKEYPVCSKTVTDGCVQAYEGRRRARRR